MKILFLCNKLPYPSKEGGAMAMNMMIEGMLKAGHSVHVLAINTNKYFFKKNEIPVDYRSKTHLETIYLDLSPRLIEALKCLLTNKSYHVQRFISTEFKQKLKQILLNNQFDIIQIETIFLTPYIPLIRKHSGASIVLRAHNIESLIWKRLAGNTKNPFKKFYLNHLASTLEKYEIDHISQYDGIIGISKIDTGHYQNITAGEIPALTATFGLNIDDYSCSKNKHENPSLAFIGALNWLPNSEGLHWFLKNIWPEIRQHYPDINFFIASKNIPQWLRKFSSEQIKLLESVENAKEFIAAHSIMVVPLLSGSGIRIKIIEGMALGKAIISTSVGAEGIEYIEGENILIANHKDEFLQSLKKCLTNIGFMEQLRINARKNIEKNYNANNIIKEVELFYQQIIKI